MGNYSTSKYRERKAGRQADTKPEWVTNPETGEQFYLRNTRSTMSAVLAGYMPSGLTNAAVEAWKAKGVAGLETLPGSDDLAAIVATLTPEQIEAGNRNMQRLSRIIKDACLIPLLSNENPDTIEFSPVWLADVTKGLTERDPEFDPATFDPKELVLDPRDLDDKDTTFLFGFANGLVGTVKVKGGGTMNVTDIKSLAKRAGRRTRSSNPVPAVRQSA
jgi:hypothetical protein